MQNLKGRQHIKDIVFAFTHGATLYFLLNEIRLVSQLEIWDWLTFPHILSPLWFYMVMFKQPHEIILWKGLWKGTCAESFVFRLIWKDYQKTKCSNFIDSSLIHWFIELNCLPFISDFQRNTWFFTCSYESAVSESCDVSSLIELELWFLNQQDNLR